MGKMLFRADLEEMLAVNKHKVSEFMRMYCHSSSGKNNLCISETEYRELERKGIIDEFRMHKNKLRSLKANEVQELGDTVRALVLYLDAFRIRFPDEFEEMMKITGGAPEYVKSRERIPNRLRYHEKMV